MKRYRCLEVGLSAVGTLYFLPYILYKQVIPTNHNMIGRYASRTI